MPSNCPIYYGDQTAKPSYLSTTLISALDYGCHVYSSTTLLNDSDTVQHNGLRLALGAFRSSPIESLSAEYDILSSPMLYTLSPTLSKLSIPQSLISTFLPAPFIVRMNNLLSLSPTSTLLCQFSSSMAYTLPQICSSVYPDPPKSDISPSVLLTHLKHVYSYSSSSFTIFTDSKHTHIVHTLN